MFRRYSAKIIDWNSNGIFDQFIIASGTIYNQVLLWSASNGNILATLSGHQGVIFNIEFSTDTNILFSTSDDRSINVWQIDTIVQSDLTKTIQNTKLYHRFYGHEARVWKCISFFDKDTLFLCSIGEDLNCCLWNVSNKSLLHRFEAMRKGAKNIWSICMHKTNQQIVTGWADGGLRKFDLKNYLRTKTHIDSTPQNDPMNISNETEIETSNDTMSSESKTDQIEWNLTEQNDKDFIRTLALLSEHIIFCTNLGYVYLIEVDSTLNQEQVVHSNKNQKLLFKSILLSNYNIFAKVKMSQSENSWCLAIGTLKGFIYLLNIKFKSNKKHEITMNCINCLSIEEELAEVDSNLLKLGAPKICNLLWFEYKQTSSRTRYFLIACFSFLNGLMHLYELDESNQLAIVARLYLPQCKHRWLTSFCIISIKNELHMNESNDSLNNQLVNEHIYLTGGDKCGNLYLYHIEHVKKENASDEQDEVVDEHHLKLTKPIQSFKNLTKQSSTISALYSVPMSSEVDSHLLICCCKDGFYRIFEFADDEYESTLDERMLNESAELKENINREQKVLEENVSNPSDDASNPEKEKHEQKRANEQVEREMLKLTNKFQVNSYVEIIESFLFDHDNEFATLVRNEHTTSGMAFDLENNLRLAMCFYGDKFLLWNFQLNRAIFEFKCGGAYRSWDYEFCAKPNNHVLFRFVYVKNKCIGEARKHLSIDEIDRPTSRLNNHLCQMFHGNTITVCKYLQGFDYILTGGEDTQLILSRIEQSISQEKTTRLNHQLHLQGHDSVVKCLSYMHLNEHEILLVSAGGKANIKLWKLITNSENGPSDSVSRVVHLCELRKFKNKANLSARCENKAQFINDLKSNPDVRFMDVVIFKENDESIRLVFACSDGYVRIFKYSLETNRLELAETFMYTKCLLGIRYLRCKQPHLLAFGTDGCLLFWPFHQNQREPKKLEKIHQSGINDLDVWYESDCVFLATVGDDTSIKIVAISSVDDLNLETSRIAASLEMAHASAIVGLFGFSYFFSLIE